MDTLQIVGLFNGIDICLQQRTASAQSLELVENVSLLDLAVQYSATSFVLAGDLQLGS